MTTLVEATSTTTTTEPLPPLERLSLEVVADRLDQPVFVAPGPDRNVLLVVEREGIIRIVDSDGAVEDLPFLDLTDVVGSSGIEQGLLGMALHPVDVSRMFVYYSLPSNDTVLAELPIAGELPDIGGLTEILRFEQPTERHNAGMIQFGPDGYLYLSLGEGGAASTHAQDPNTLLSSILRLDVDGGAPYLVPADNPFVGGGGAPEVWAFGLRNPWRFDIDPVDGLMYIADVGHSDWEEIDVVSLDGGGYNFGWLTMEGSHCFSSTDCDTDGLELPAAEYPHSEGCSVTGGYVYRGSAIPEIEGHYFYGDWCTGFIRSFRYVDGAVVDERDWTDELGFSGQVNSFGLDAAGELLIATWDGTVYRVVPIR
ncbi:MAG: PQQ-dependent sugar dehydrogenase [Acidimicrobiia bacterium]|nr:PQQ-dependent sugar dehydrogenase [Acidimicrobiia bacterium]